MDKFEYKVRAEEIKSLIAKGEYAQAAEIADSIDWRRVKSVMMLCTISDLYKINRRYEDARDMLLLAYDRHPGGRTICYSLCELSIKMEEFVEAVEYYKEFVQIAPKDTGRYILQYKLYEAQDVSLEERIAVLEELKKRDYREKWAYELAYLYHRVGLSTRCVEECDELILWFGDGKYVVKALELKMLHEPLTPQQQQKYEYRLKPGNDQVQEKESTVQKDDDRKTQTLSESAGKEQSAAAKEKEAPESEEFDIHVKTVDVSQYNTINLQRELAEGLKEVLGEELPAIADPVAGSFAEPVSDGDTESLDSLQIEEVDEETFEPGVQETEVFFGETGDLGSVEVEEKPRQKVRDPFEEVLSMEPDGQISLVVPKVQEADRQITGQMNIDDVMKEWERLKKEAELDMDIPDEAEELVEIQEAEALDEPIEDEPAAEELDEPIEDEPAAEGSDEPELTEVPAREESQPEKPHLRSLSKEEKALFGPFIQSRSAKNKLAAMLDAISMASYTGNVILTGDEGVDTLNLAKNIIRYMQLSDSNFSGKTAKISGRALNQKDVAQIIDQLQNGALIIQKASAIDEKTAAAIYKTLQRESQGIIVILEDTGKNMNRFLERNEMLLECFTARMDAEALSNETLVAFGRKYAAQMEYSIDDLGILALHTRIEELQSADHAVTVMEVKEIVDEAIEKAGKKNIKHFFDILMAKRYDDEDMIILRENDFM